MFQASSNNNTRIAKNTLLLYVRMLFTMAVSLFTSRVILNTLGVEDYGIYNVVGRLVSMFFY
jgi:O-antigen/teichoic acid export membrane protein